LIYRSNIIGDYYPFDIFLLFPPSTRFGTRCFYFFWQV